MMESDYKVVRAELNPKTGQCRYRIRVNSPPPSLEWGVSIGEVAHNLRSALDGLVYESTLLKTKTPAGNTQYPIFLNGTTIKRMRGKRKELIPHFEGMRRGDGRSMIRQLCEEHQTFIEGLQPYKRGRGGRNNPLFWLKQINNADKHRLIQAVGAKTGAGPVVGGWGEQFDFHFRIRPGMILKDGAILMEAPCNMHMSPKLMPLVSFWEGCPDVKGRSVVNTFRVLSREVSRIIECFSPEFDCISHHYPFQRGN